MQRRGFFFSASLFLNRLARVQVGAVYEWKVGNDTWTMDLKNGNGAVVKGSQGKADCTLTMAEAVFVDLMQGKTNAQQAFMQGKLKIGGNMGTSLGEPKHTC